MNRPHTLLILFLWDLKSICLLHLSVVGPQHGPLTLVASSRLLSQLIFPPWPILLTTEVNVNLTTFHSCYYPSVESHSLHKPSKWRSSPISHYSPRARHPSTLDNLSFCKRTVFSQALTAWNASVHSTLKFERTLKHQKFSHFKKSEFWTSLKKPGRAS